MPLISINSTLPSMEPSLFTVPLTRIIVALLAGMLIGIEREKARAAAARRRKRTPGLEELVVKEFPGLRTFSLVAVLGSIAGYMWQAGFINDIVFTVIVLTFSLIVTIFTGYRLVVAKMAGITTVVVLVLDFLIGLLAGLGLEVLAASTAVLTTFMLAIKLPVERIVGRIRYEELLWALELGIVLVVVGPFFLPYTTTFLGVSLRSLYLFFALVLATSYIGYVLARLMGGEGLAYTALFGGLANSEATLMSTLSLLGERARGIGFDITVLVNTAMVVRNVAIALILASLTSRTLPLTPNMLALILSALLPSLLAYYSWSKLVRKLTTASIEIENPLRFTAAFKTTLFYLVLSLAAYTVRETGIGSLLAVSVIGGFVSSSAAIVALYSAGIRSVDTLAYLAIMSTIAGVMNKPLYAYLAIKDKQIIKRVIYSSIVYALILITTLILGQVS